MLRVLNLCIRLIVKNANYYIISSNRRFKLAPYLIIASQVRILMLYIFFWKRRYKFRMKAFIVKIFLPHVQINLFKCDISRNI